jgi:hypothetical protein
MIRGIAKETAKKNASRLQHPTHATLRLLSAAACGETLFYRKP